MAHSINRRNFLQMSTAAAAIAATQKALAAVNGQPEIEQEYYEIRVYRTKDAGKIEVLADYLENALVPALNQMGIDRIGVFRNMDQLDDYAFYLLIPYSNLEMFASVNNKLQANKKYQKQAEGYFSALKNEPVFSRIQSRFYKAFKGMPVIEIPKQTTNKEARIFELRIYESHTEEKAALKVDMFNSGEIQIMRDAEMAPVFFGEALIGDDLPNLTYMLSASDRKAHEAHWSTFGDHPEWIRMRVMPKYKDTVSKITKIFLIPTDYSQL